MASEQTTSQIEQPAKPKKFKIKKKKKHHSCIKIQACWRRYNFRKKKVLEPCYIDELDIGTPKLIECLKKDYLTPGRIEYYKSTTTMPQCLLLFL